MILGIDIGGTKCAVVLGDEKGNILKKEVYATSTVHDTLNWIVDTAEKLKGESRAIGISCGGPLDSKKGIILSPPNLPGWDNVPIVKLLEDKFDRPTFLKNDADACAIADKIISESQDTDKWYEFFDAFASLLNHPKSLVRNRVLYILSANAQWDDENRFDAIISDYLSHVTDDKPITARQCIKALAQVGVAKPQYIPRILSCFQEADLSKYKDSMRPLIESGYVYSAVPPLYKLTRGKQVRVAYSDEERVQPVVERQVKEAFLASRGHVLDYRTFMKVV